MTILIALLFATVPATTPASAGDGAIESGVIAKGDRLMLVSQVGPITIERPVTAMQGRRPHDRRIFVRTDDGEVFAAAVGAEGGSK